MVRSSLRLPDKNAESFLGTQVKKEHADSDIHIDNDGERERIVFNINQYMLQALLAS